MESAESIRQGVKNRIYECHSVMADCACAVSVSAAKDAGSAPKIENGRLTCVNGPT